LSRRIKRIGLTQRIVNTPDYKETRDALAHDWYKFAADNLPEVMCITLPNIGNEITSYIDTLDIDAIIFTGGNDIGNAPIRDRTENALLEYAQSNELPIIGVCRGMQLIQCYFGGELTRYANDEHVATSHKVYFSESCPVQALRDISLTVNSFHTSVIVKSAEPLIPFAFDEHNSVEGFYHPESQLLGIMWHPERSNNDFDKSLFRNFLGL
jgi:gamma-glutamyl-gamma-aminobutyrate hydrolase PuuD